MFSQEKVYQKFYYPDSTLASEGWVVGNKPDGQWKNYYPDGTLKSEGKRTNTLLDSIWNFYDEKGFLTQSISYLFGTKNGFTISYYPSFSNDKQIVKSMELYVQGKREGKALYYDEDGILIKSIPYENDVKEGNGIEYCENGNACYTLKFRGNQLIDRQRINQRNEQGEKIGIWRDFYENGSVKTEQEFQSGLLQGKTKYYTSNGQLLKTEYFTNDSLVKEFTENINFEEPTEKIEYHTNGNIKFKGTYRDSIAVGAQRFYNEEGKIVNAKIYDLHGTLLEEGILTESGIKSGDWKVYYDGILLHSKGKYRNNLKFGEWVYYYKSGKIKQKGEFESDKENGLWTLYNENGSILKEEEYFQGLLNGYVKEYDDSSQIILSGSYIDGMKNGKWLTIIGDNKEIGEFKDDKKIGKWKHFYRNDIKRFEGNYKYGREEGKHKYYYSNGKIEHIEIYKNGRKEKKWSYYNRNGVLIRIEEYENDKEKSIITF